MKHHANHQSTSKETTEMADLTKYNGEYVSSEIRKPLSDTKEAKSFLISGNEFLTQPNPIKWLIKGVLQENSIAMIHGQSGSGKSLLALDWMLHLATGKNDWFGHEVYPCDVVYLNGEGHHGMYSRVAAWAADNGVSNIDRFCISHGSEDLDNPLQLRKVIDEIHGTGLNPGVIVIDTLNRFFSKDENYPQDIRIFLNACQNLHREFGSSIIIVHHTGIKAKSQGRARGSSMWRSSMDQEFSIAPQGKSGLTLAQIKIRDGETMDPIKLKLRVINIPGWLDDDNEPVSSVVLEKVDRNTNQIKQQPNQIFESPICVRESEEDSNG
jgi:hypothetical protein